MTRAKLSKPERLVLFALAEDANRTDADIAERVDMKESTVGLHRRNLLKKEQVFFVNFPNFHKLGCEFVVEFFGHSNPAIPYEEKNEEYKAFFSKNPQIFDSVAGEGFLMASACFTSSSQLLMFEERHEAFFENNPMSKSLMKQAIFPFEISRCCLPYNFAPSLHRILELDIPNPVSRKLETHHTGELKLSKVEKNTLVEMIEHPNATDSQLGQKIRRSRARVNEMKHLFLKEGLFTRVAVPTLESSEFGALADVHLNFKPGTTFEKKKHIAGDDWWKQSCYTLERNLELFAIYAFSNFREYTALINEYVGPFQEANLLTKEPEIFVISTENIVDLVDSSFGPLVRNLLM